MSIHTINSYIGGKLKPNVSFLEESIDKLNIKKLYHIFSTSIVDEFIKSLSSIKFTNINEFISMILENNTEYP